MFRSVIISYALLIFLSSSTAYSQQVTGNLQGSVTDAHGNPLPDVNITVSGEDVQGIRGATTNAGGFFRVLALPVGRVTVEISHIAHHPVKSETVPIRLGKTTTLGEVRLEPATIEFSNVVVTAARPTIDPNSTTVGANISAEEFEALPTERDYLTITSLLPQANTSFLGDDVNVAGATGQENVYYIDGMNTTEMYRAIGSTSLPYNFIKEIEIKSGGYEAEYGRATGGIVNVITHSGSNNLSARAFGFFTDNRFASDRKRGFVELNTGRFTRYDAGFSLGGPVLKDKLWFFLAYNARVEEEDITLEGLGVRTDKLTINTFAGKLTWQPSPRTNLLLSVLGDPSDRDRIAHNATPPFDPSGLANADPFLGKFERGGLSFSLKGSHLLGKDLQLEASLSRHASNQTARAATEIGRQQPLFIDNTTGIWSGGYGEEFDRYAKRYAASLTGTYFLHSHTFKAGFQFEDNVFDEYWFNDNEVGPRLGTILRNAEDAYLALPWFLEPTVRNRVISGFAQSSISLHSKLRANVGIRWDGQYLKGFGDGFSANITDQFQPRVGVIFQPSKIGNQKISASFGRFYEQIPSRPLIFIVGDVFQDGVFFDHDPREDPTGGVRTVFFDETEVPLDPDIVGEHFDEFTLGYEREVGTQYKLGIRGSYRAIREIIQNSDDPVTGAIQAITGNPGRGLLSSMPKPVRDYTALELTFEKFAGKRLRFSASYVLSRNYGNYTGLFSSDSGLDLPNAGTQFDNPEQLVNATGLLPNDRTHVFKYNGSYRFDFGLVVGTSFIWQTGTPLSEIGAQANPFSYRFLQKRGAVGRTPSIWDLNLRFTYDLSRVFRANFSQKLILDVFHLFSEREPVHFAQQHFFAVDPDTGEQITENPNYLQPITFQPPMTIRLGLEVGF